MNKIFLISSILSSIIISLTACTSSSNIHSATWEKNFGNNSRDRILGLTSVKDGYLLTGYSVSEKTNEDILIIKLDFNGNFKWGRKYGGKEYDRGHSITGSDYGAVVAGITDTGKGGARDIWVLSLDSDGSILWNKVLGGFKEDYGYSVKSLSDGFIVAGTTRSFNVPGQQVWVIKLDKEGNVAWDKKYGENNISYCYDIDITPDGFILTGSTLNGNNHDLLVISLDRYGSRLWERVYGSSGDEYGRSVKWIDGGFVVAGSTTSKGGGSSDAWVLRLDENGKILWEGTFGSRGKDSAESIEKAGEDFIISGYSSPGAHALDSRAWIFRVDKKGELAWSRMFDKSSYAAGVVVDSKGYFSAGSLINQVDAGGSFWAVKLDKEGLLIKNKKNK